MKQGKINLLKKNKARFNFAYSLQESGISFSFVSVKRISAKDHSIKNQLHYFRAYQRTALNLSTAIEVEFMCYVSLNRTK